VIFFGSNQVLDLGLDGKVLGLGGQVLGLVGHVFGLVNSGLDYKSVYFVQFLSTATLNTSISHSSATMYLICGGIHYGHFI